MSILINKNTRLIVQGITGRDGGFHATKMKAYGTNVVGGTSPGKAGQEVSGIPVFNTVRDAVEATQANTSVIFVPAAFAKDAMMEAADAGIQLIVCITEGVPTLDVVQAYNYIRQKGAKLIGPNCPGLISPEERAAEYIKAHVTKPVAAFISGREAPKGKQMGHAGAIISSGSGTAKEKVAAFEAAGIPVARETSEIPMLLKKQLEAKR